MVFSEGKGQFMVLVEALMDSVAYDPSGRKWSLQLPLVGRTGYAKWAMTQWMVTLVLPGGKIKHK